MNCVKDRKSWNVGCRSKGGPVTWEMSTRGLTPTTMAASSRTHRLRRGTVIYATGFLVTRTQMEDMARNVCPDSFIARHGRDLAFALMWYVSRHKYELLDGDHPGDHLFAVHFFPWYGDLKDAPPALCSLSAEQKYAWYETYGRHAGKDYEERTMKYPTESAAAPFMEKRLQEVITEANLWDLLEPAVPSGVACARPAPASVVVS
ncbi:hypothetical protein MVEN_00031500 [Mycena venus]|uniref:Uncharacterized protein n=1 Tax=Mycena venus TaxID=2733690 RepID=A0A8H6Z9Q1_9AGAR|nr:hypothetical protein MVEN_00031500 [Mycena venus]